MHAERTQLRLKTPRIGAAILTPKLHTRAIQHSSYFRTTVLLLVDSFDTQVLLSATNYNILYCELSTFKYIDNPPPLEDPNPRQWADDPLHLTSLPTHRVRHEES